MCYYLSVVLMKTIFKEQHVAEAMWKNLKRCLVMQSGNNIHNEDTNLVVFTTELQEFPIFCRCNRILSLVVFCLFLILLYPLLLVALYCVKS